MIVAIVVILLIVLVLLLLAPRKKLTPEGILLTKIYPLTQKELTLDESIQLIEYSRAFTMIFVQQIQNKKLKPELKSPINELLGLILQISREENHDDIAKAIHQIEIINSISLEIKDFFKKHFLLFYRNCK